MIQVIPGRPSQSGLLWWLAHDEPLPARTYRPALPASAREIFVTLPGRSSWGSVLALISVTGLPADHEVELVLGSLSARSRTLPAEIAPGTAFTIALGSCFAGRKRPGASIFYEPEIFGPAEKVQLRFLCGDQVYMDLPWSTSSPKPGRKYLGQWSEQAAFYRKSPTVMLADDHEFWNDFPHQQVHVLWDPDRPTDPLWRELVEAYEHFELPLNLDPSLVAASQDANQLLEAIRRESRSVSFQVPPLSFFALDTRSERTLHDLPQPHFAAPQRLGAAMNWLRTLQGPGILVLSEPFVAEEASYFRPLGIKAAATDWHFPAYEADYASLLDALFDAPHDVVVLSGDIHWSRLLHIKENRRGRAIYELISSPLSLIAEQAAPHPSIRTGDAGKLSWRSARFGSQSATWYAMAVPPAEVATYATVRFRRLPTGVGLEALVDFWGQMGGAPTSPRQMIPTVTLRLS